MPQLDAGTYFGKLVQIGEDQLNTEKATPFIFVEWEITHRAVGGDWVPLPQPERRETRWWCTDAAEPYTLRRLERLGWNGNLSRPAFMTDPDPMQQGVILSCRHDVRDGQTFEVWDLPSEERSRSSWDPMLRHKFEAKYQTQRLGHAAPSGEPASPPSPPVMSEITDDEVPTDDDVLEDVPEEEIPY